MRMIPVYGFSELEGKAAIDRALEYGREVLATDPAFYKESELAILDFCKSFGVSVSLRNIEAYSRPEFKDDATAKNFRGLKLKDFCNAEARANGYCLSFYVWETFYKRWRSTMDPLSAFVQTLALALREWVADLEAQLEDSYVSEFLESNSFEFLANGEPVQAGW